MLLQQLSVASTLLLVITLVISILFSRLVYNIFLHPLAKFPGPWYASATSFTSAVASVLHFEPQWLLKITKAYGTNVPIRISPNMLLLPKPTALKSIYWDPKCNEKASMFGSGVLGPPHLFTICDAEEHRVMRKALAGPHWSMSYLKNSLESKIDNVIRLFVQNMTEKADKQVQINFSNKVAEFAADIMTVFTFGEPWGFVQNDRDERHLLSDWHKGLHFFAIASHWRTFRENILPISWVQWWLLPKTSNESGVGYIMAQSDREVTQREKMQLSINIDKQDFLQHCLDARIKKKPLTPVQVRASVNLLLQAGADPTGTSIGSTLRFLSTHPSAQARVLKEVWGADQAGLLSTPVKMEETRAHLPYLVACIKETTRLEPPATNTFARVVGKEGKVIDGFEIPAGTDITSCAYVVQRDPVLYAPDPDSFRPERWLESIEKSSEMEAGSFVFGMGPRGCIGKDVALMALYKLLPETLRRFELELLNKGTFVVVGGIAYNKDFIVKIKARE
ncbi:Cytochrome P450 monooxygenase gsfF [Lachnellula cervina]|uniref:Cytochrome P450 monooxygenase gsfF n=1 Tax=Lachnellula cervina TaxID=1316786 RepID=A0A7D8UPX0_9HELO|nr:Cytochrome P450 monooxygenase gsfF [Lachnellula cervina]